jgi:hypothetical protein
VRVGTRGVKTTGVIPVLRDVAGAGNEVQRVVAAIKRRHQIHVVARTTDSEADVAEVDRDCLGRARQPKNRCRKNCCFRHKKPRHLKI